MMKIPYLVLVFLTLSATLVVSDVGSWQLAGNRNGC